MTGIEWQAKIDEIRKTNKVLINRQNGVDEWAGTKQYLTDLDNSDELKQAQADATESMQSEAEAERLSGYDVPGGFNYERF